MIAPLPLHEQMAARRERLAPRGSKSSTKALHAGTPAPTAPGAGTHFRVRIACPPSTAWAVPGAAPAARELRCTIFRCRCYAVAVEVA